VIRVLEIAAAVLVVGAALMAWDAARLRRQIPVVLDVLSRAPGPLSGRAITLLAGIGRGAIYVLLAQMEDDGLVTAEERLGGPERGGLPKRLYSITDAGRARARRTGT